MYPHVMYSYSQELEYIMSLGWVSYQPWIISIPFKYAIFPYLG